MDPAIVLRTVVLVLIAYLMGSIPMGVVVARVTGGTEYADDRVGQDRGHERVARTRARAGRDRGDRRFSSRVPCRCCWHATSRVAIRWSRFSAEAAAVAGAIWSVFAGFRSGRGVGTGVGTMLVIQPVAVLLATPSSSAWSC